MFNFTVLNKECCLCVRGQINELRAVYLLVDRQTCIDYQESIIQLTVPVVDNTVEHFPNSTNNNSPLSLTYRLFLGSLHTKLTEINSGKYGDCGSHQWKIKEKETEGDCCTRERRDTRRVEETMWEMQMGK